ncbi:MAG TPA: hypothetical protein VK631_14935 [Solirubrobacteraceae bacterium]|nr:hypothetical protein [Solirubrobacteraceae bacterium]
MRGRAELALFAGAYLVYNAGRWATNGDVDRAQTNARRVIDFQGGSLRTRSPVRAAHAAASRRGRDDQDARARQHRRRRAHPLSDDLQRVILLDERGSSSTRSNRRPVGGLPRHGPRLVAEHVGEAAGTLGDLPAGVRFTLFQTVGRRPV